MTSCHAAIELWNKLNTKVGGSFAFGGGGGGAASGHGGFGGYGGHGRLVLKNVLRVRQ